MKSNEFKLTILKLFKGFLGIFRGFSSKEERAKEQCEQNMRMIASASRRYRLEKGLPLECLVDPKNLSVYFSEGVRLRCPSGEIDYEPFVYTHGPTCPNAPDKHAGPQVKAIVFIHSVDRHTSIFGKLDHWFKSNWAL